MTPRLFFLLAAIAAAALFFQRAPFVYGFSDPRLIAVVTAMCAFFVVLPSATPKRRFHWQAVVAVSAYCAYFFLPAVLTSNAQLTIFGFPGACFGGVVFTCVAAGGLLAASALTEEEARTAQRAVIACGCLCIFYAVAQRFGVDPWGIPVSDPRRAGGLLGSPVDLGALTVVICSVLPVPLALAVGLVGAWASVSKGALLGLAVSLAPRDRRIPAFLLCSAVAVGAVLFAPPSAVKQQQRKEMWKTAAQHITWKGTGPATFFLTLRDHPLTDGRKQAHAHNAVLEALTTKGWLFGWAGIIIVAFFPLVAGLWAVMMVNPVSFEVVFLAAVLCGCELALAPRDHALDARGEK